MTKFTRYAPLFSAAIGMFNVGPVSPRIHNPNLPRIVKLRPKAQRRSNKRASQLMKAACQRLFRRENPHAKHPTHSVGTFKALDKTVYHQMNNGELRRADKFNS